MSMPDIRRTIKYATNLARLLTRLAREVPTIVRKSSRPVHAFIHFFTYSLLHSFTSSLNHFITHSFFHCPLLTVICITVSADSPIFGA